MSAGRSVVVDRRRRRSSRADTRRTPTSSALRYSTQDYLGGNPAALAAATDGSRNVGDVYAFDRWTLTSRCRRRVRRPLRPLRLSPERGVFQPARRVHHRAGQEHARVRNRGAAHGRARRRGVRRQPDARAVAAAGAHVRAARRARATNAFSVERARYVDVVGRARFRRAVRRSGCAASTRTSTISS